MERSSVLSRHRAAAPGAYSAAKAAGWAIADALRNKFMPMGIHVAALNVGFMDTTWPALAPMARIAPAVVAEQAIDRLMGG